MWIGVTNGLAGIKFSASPKIFGKNNAMNVRDISNTVNPTMSLNVWYIWKGTIFIEDLIPRGLFEPV